MFSTGMGMDFVDEVSAALTPGTAAIVADIDETWVTPVDTRLAALGGTTYRRYTGEVIDEQLERETAATRAELDDLRAQLREATGQAKANARAAIDRQRQKLEALVARIDKALDQQKAEYEARLSTLKAQREQAKEEQRQRIDARIAELKASHEARTRKLEEARRLARESAELTKEALVP
jgi:parvulin-like peptidyl-prolyl isomerase